EPTIGSAWIQFDLRFYVVALLFVIFDVELAFFFPWAVVFGSANRAGDESLSEAQRYAAVQVIQPAPPPVGTRQITAEDLAEMRKTSPEEMERLTASSKAYLAPEPSASPAAARQLAWLAFADIMVFFAVLLVGFAYLWRR